MIRLNVVGSIYSVNYKYVLVLVIELYHSFQITKRSLNEPIYKLISIVSFGYPLFLQQLI